MPKNVSDRVILREIHDRYYNEFCSFKDESPSRSSKIYVPIDCKAIAKKLDLDPEIVFGRLYYHLERKYGYRGENGSTVSLFAVQVGDDLHAVNFPLLSAVVAELDQAFIRFTWPLGLSILAIIISILGYFGVGT